MNYIWELLTYISFQMKKLYKFLLIIVVNATFALGSFAQSNIVSQSFEGSGTWNYVEFPAPYTVYSPPSDIWGICGNTYVTTPVNPNGSSWFTYNNGDVVAPLLSGISSWEFESLHPCK